MSTFDGVYRGVVDAEHGSIKGQEGYEVCNHDFDEYGQCFECDEIATAAKYALSKGLTGLTQVSELTGASLQTLDNWYKHKPELFNVVLAGCVALI